MAFFSCQSDELAVALDALQDTNGGAVHQIQRTEFTAAGRMPPETVTIRTLGPAALAARTRYGYLDIRDPGITQVTNLAAALGVGGVGYTPREVAGEELVFELDAALSEALAGASPAALRAAGEAWMALWTADLAGVPMWNGVVPAHQIPELDGPDGWGAVLSRLAKLARAARKKGRMVVVWWLG